MVEDPRVEQLLEEALDSGLTVEEVCRDCPELLPQVRALWQRLHALQAQVGVLFPEAAPTPDCGSTAPVPRADLPQVDGYEVEGVLGRGGMGVVYRARHLRLERPVALKMLLAGAYASAEERQRFLREAQAVAALRHPNIVQVYDVGDHEGRPFFTMELVEGGSLAQKLAGAPQPARQAAELVARLAEAVQAAHQGGILHRDLKPSNVLLTQEGTPRVTDFGLARRLEGAAGLTLSGAPMGTPSYMAPEQAQGKTAALGPAVDVYALGGILYECLTGQPPFRAETAAATVLQVINQEPAPLSRLNARVPRDLEIICLKCLSKEPSRRYASAAALGDDLVRFLHGEAIAARPEGRLARLARRARQRPFQSAALAACALLTITLVGGGLWFVSERAAVKRAAAAERSATEQAAADDIEDMVRQLKGSRWPEATAALERARGRLGDRGPVALHNLLDQGARDLQLASRLDDIRLGGGESVGGKLAIHHSSDKQYEDAFRDAQLGQVHDDPAVVAERIRASNIHNALVAALDHWSSCASDERRKEWVLRVARLADRDPTGWRDRARDPLVRKDDAAFTKVIESTRFGDQSVALLLALELQLLAQEKNTIAYLKQIQRAHPGDFWINFRLGEVMRARNAFGEAIRYYQAAHAIRPKAAVVCHNLGTTLALAGQPQEAIEQLRIALQLDPTATPAHNNLAMALMNTGRYDEAIAQVRVGLRVCSNRAPLHSTLGACLERKGRFAEAIAEHRRAVEMAPQDSGAQKALREILLRRGRAEEARAAWQAALAKGPPEYEDWYGYAELCLYLGREEEYRVARRALLARFGTTTYPIVAERTGRACLLLPAAGDELRQAVALAERAAAASGDSELATFAPYFLFVRGLADYRQGRFEPAIATMRGEASQVLGPAPGLVLAMALYRTGKTAEARQALTAAVVGHDWRAGNVRDQDGWIYHALRREAERLVVPSFPAFLDGKYRPKDNGERLVFIGACQSLGRHRTVARLYVDAFAAEPRLMGDFNVKHRYRAARAAAQAGCGLGTDAAGVEEAERARWRKQAWVWLRGDLISWSRWLDESPAARRGIVRAVLTQWREEPDLACVRDPGELNRRAADERQAYLTLWAEVAAVIARTGK
jgi:serine/threonine-protein kinase